MDNYVGVVSRVPPDPEDPSATRLPLFPLNAVVFPRATLPLHVFEDRYRALVEHLVAEPDPQRRLFGTVAIREGYEVGSHGAQSLYRMGSVLRLTETAANPDGSFHVQALATGRFRLHVVDGSGSFPRASVQLLVEDERAVDPELAALARATFTAYRAAVTALVQDPLDGPLPQDPEALGWALAALVPLPMAERQSLLEAEDTVARLGLVIELLRAELRAINVIPSLPATEVARTRWSPN